MRHTVLEVKMVQVEPGVTRHVPDVEIRGAGLVWGRATMVLDVGDKGLDDGNDRTVLLSRVFLD